MLFYTNFYDSLTSVFPTIHSLLFLSLAFSAFAVQCNLEVRQINFCYFCSISYWSFTSIFILASTVPSLPFAKNHVRRSMGMWLSNNVLQHLWCEGSHCYSVRSVYVNAVAVLELRNTIDRGVCGLIVGNCYM